MTRLPQVCIIGCANIGKSSLFNYLAKKKIAITHDTPGVTIDCRYDTISIGEKRIILIDTPGFDETGIACSEQQKQVNLQIEEAIKSSDSIIHMLDARSNYNHLDKSWSRYYFKLNKQCIVLVNKIDRTKQAVIESDYQFSNARIIKTSIKTKEGLGQLITWLDQTCENVAISSTSEDIDETNICLVGKPNAGKSTLSNLIIGKNMSVVSNIPGTTTDTVSQRFTRGKMTYRLYDTAGMRKKNKIRREVEQYSVHQSIETIRQRDLISILMIDATGGVSDQDYRMIELLERHHKSYCIVINKWDLLSKEQKDVYRKNIDKIANNRKYIPIIFISAYKKSDLNKIFKVIDLIKRSNQLPPMSYLTKLVNRFVEDHRPPLIQNREAKLRVCFPTPNEGSSVTIQGKRISRLPASYKKYLENRLQEALNISGRKLIVRLKEDHNPYG